MPSDPLRVNGARGWLQGTGPTINDLPLALDDLFAEAAVLLQAAHGLAAVAERAVAEQRVRLHLCVLHLELVHAAQQAEHLALLFGANAPRQRLLQAPAACAQLAAALLQRHLGMAWGQRRAAGKGWPSLSACLQFPDSELPAEAPF